MLVIITIAVGICFRFINLDYKVYWHDEVYTTMRAAGFTRLDIDNEIFQNQFLTVPDLQKFQQIKPGSTAADTIRSLAVEDPQHPPLYFLMARGWMHLFGNSMLASRLLPVLLSLLGLPLMYGLAIELFESRLVAWLSTVFLALSPFDILFAQTARQYSFLTTAVIASSWLLLRAMRLKTWQDWGWYTLSVAIGLYVHPFFTLTVAAQGAYVLLIAAFDKLPTQLSLEGRRSSQPQSQSQSWYRSFSRFFSSFQLRLLIPFLVSIVTALILYSPWIFVLSTNLQRASSTTDWTRASVGLVYLSKLWELSFTSLFVDIDFGFDSPFTYLFRLPYLLIIIVAVYMLCRRAPQTAWLFILASILVPFLMLALPDLVLGGKRSAVSRYLISCYPAIQLAVAYSLTVGLSSGRFFWRWILGLLLTSSIISSWISGQAESWWNKDLSYLNAAIARVVNTTAETTSPILFADIGNDYTNTGDLISLSYKLKDNVRFFLVSQPPELLPLAQELDNGSTILTFRPSEKLKAAIAQNNWQLGTLDYQPIPDFSEGAKLWQIEK